MPIARASEKNVVRRLPAEERRDAMLAAAAEHFAEHGFESTTRDLARALNVTQALIYKHFGSKEDFIERTLARVFTREAGGGPWLDDRAPLRAELLRFYTAFVSNASDQRMRLFIRAGLDGRSWPTRRGKALTVRLFLPAISALRREAGLPQLDAVPAMRGERELVMMLHASMVFLGIRRHIYRMEMPADLSDVVSLYVATFMNGAPESMRHLHEHPEQSLMVPLATQPD